MQKAIYRNYQASIRELRRTGTWLPGDILRIGEVGRLKHGCFVRDRTLPDLGIDFRVEDGSPNDYFTRASARQQSYAADAAVRGVADGDLRFEFDKCGKFVLSARGLLHRRIENIGHVCDQIVRLHELGKWDASWIVVEQVWTAEFLMVLISRSAKAGVTLRASSGYLPGLEALSDPKFDVGVHHQAGDVWQERGPNKTPFFSGRRLKRRLFRGNETEQISTRGTSEDEVDVFGLEFDDLMESWADDEGV